MIRGGTRRLQPRAPALRPESGVPHADSEEPVSGAVRSTRPGQSRAMSLAEAVANVIVGYVLAVLAQLMIFPVLGLQATLTQTLKIGAAFTVISILRSYALRRTFEALRLRGLT